MEISCAYFIIAQVTYNCVLSWRPEYRLRICEGDSQSISCVCHWSIGIISANYGRMAGGHICPGPINTTNCGAVGSLNITKTACQGKQYCDLQAKNSVYGDPCPGTRKYLEVRSFGPTFTLRSLPCIALRIFTAQNFTLN